MATDTHNVTADPSVGNRRRDLPLIGRWRFEADDLEELRAALDWPHAGTRRADEVEAALVAEALHAGRSWTSYSRSKDWYARTSRYQLPRGFGYRPVLDAVGHLDDFGLVDHDRKKPSSQSLGFQSRFRASARLMAVATEHPPALRCGPPRSLLILRDENGHASRFRPTAWTRAVARRVAEIEEMLASVHADLDRDTPCRWRCGDFLEVADRHGAPYSIHVGHVPLCRIFNGSWQGGGRFVGPPYQSWPRRIRAHMSLDGAPTAELDYGATHLRILLADAGLDVAAGDLFDLAGFERDLVKRVVYIAINAETLRSALLAAADERPRRKGTYAKAAAIIDAVKARFPALAPYLHSNAGLGLMRTESDIAEYVLLALARRGIAALPVHDSFVVEAKNAAVLEEAMVDAWSRFVAPNAVVSRKVSGLGRN